MSWYLRRDDFDQLRSVFEDRDSFFETFEEWEAMALKAEQSLQRMGTHVMRAYLDAIQFPAWCREEGIPMNGDARVRWGHRLRGVDEFW